MVSAALHWGKYSQDSLRLNSSGVKYKKTRQLLGDLALFVLHHSQIAHARYGKILNAVKPCIQKLWRSSEPSSVLQWFETDNEIKHGFIG